MGTSSCAGETRLSVAIPVLNGMPFIQETVTSVLNQLGPIDELVVVDNASTDGTLQYLSSLSDDRIRLVARHQTQPVADNWTQAVQETRGQYVKLVCGDDVVMPDCLDIQIAALERSPKAVLVASQRTVVDEWGSILIQRHGLRGIGERVSGNLAIRRCLVAGTNLLGEPAAVMFRGELIRAVMPWEERWPYVLDLATYARLADSGDFIAIHWPLAKFRVSSTSWSSQILSQQPEDFRGWSVWVRKHLNLEWTMLDGVKGEVNLRIRSLIRRYFFWRVSRKAQERQGR